MYPKIPQKRYRKTLDFLKENLPPPATILDLGIQNPLSKLMEKQGYKVLNTKGEDLDKCPEIVSKYEVDAVTAFEIFEHLYNPYTVLEKIACKKIIATVPLKLWFAKAYKNEIDPWDCHFHEFEKWQFDSLLEKTNWKIKKNTSWTSPIKKLGFRPILRFFTPRYYAVYAEKM